jgi:hypothetical protein
MGACSSVNKHKQNDGLHHIPNLDPKNHHIPEPKAIRNQISSRTEYDGKIFDKLDVNKYFTLGNHIGNGSYGLVREGN